MLLQNIATFPLTHTTIDGNQTRVNDTVGDFNSTITAITFVPAYNLLHVILTSILLGIIIFATIIGNTFVVAAILLDRNLQRVSNYLILSLAITDLMVAGLVMPISVLNEVSEKWWLGVALCDLWIVMDVTCCTASILHLVAIAIDRYWAVTRLDYIRNRTARPILTMIAIVLVTALVVSLPTRFHLNRQESIETELLRQGLCSINQEYFFTIFSTVAAFYLPMAFLIFIYAKIYKAARDRIRKRAFKNATSTTTTRTNLAPTIASNEHSTKDPPICDSHLNNSQAYISSSCEDCKSKLSVQFTKPRLFVNYVMTNLRHVTFRKDKCTKTRSAASRCFVPNSSSNNDYGDATNSQTPSLSPTNSSQTPCHCNCPIELASLTEYSSFVQSPLTNDQFSPTFDYSNSPSFASGDEQSPLTDIHFAIHSDISEESEFFATQTDSDRVIAVQDTTLSDLTEPDQCHQPKQVGLQIIQSPIIHSSTFSTENTHSFESTTISNRLTDTSFPVDYNNKSTKYLIPRFISSPFIFDSDCWPSDNHHILPRRISLPSSPMLISTSTDASLATAAHEPISFTIDHDGQGAVGSSRTCLKESSNESDNECASSSVNTVKNLVNGHLSVDDKSTTPVKTCPVKTGDDPKCNGSPGMMQWRKESPLTHNPADEEQANGHCTNQPIEIPSTNQSQDQQKSGARSIQAIVNMRSSIIASGERTRERLEHRRERKAARTLAAITGCFILCWLPFFVDALIKPFCGSRCEAPRPVQSLLLWLGYLNSLLNPILYTVFSPDFRSAFAKIVCGRFGGARI